MCCRYRGSVALGASARTAEQQVTLPLDVCLIMTERLTTHCSETRRERRGLQSSPPVRRVAELGSLAGRRLPMNTPPSNSTRYSRAANDYLPALPGGSSSELRRSAFRNRITRVLNFRRPVVLNIGIILGPG